MSATYKIALNPGSTVTAHSDTTASTQADRGKDNLVLIDKPLRVYESSVTASSTATSMHFDMGSANTLGAIFIDNINVTSPHVQIWSGTGSDATTFEHTALADEITPVLDKRTGRYKYLFIPDSTKNHRYWRVEVIVGATLLGTDTKVKCGGVTLIETAKYIDFPAGNYPLTYTIQSPQITNKFPGGATESIGIGERFVSFATPNIDYIRGTQEDTILDILDNELLPITFYENDGNTDFECRAYTCKLVSAKPQKVTYKTQSTTQMTFSFTECI